MPAGAFRNYVQMGKYTQHLIAFTCVDSTAVAVHVISVQSKIGSNSESLFQTCLYFRSERSTFLRLGFRSPETYYGSERFNDLILSFVYPIIRINAQFCLLNIIVKINIMLNC